jgi:hypothetical protein
MDIHSDDGSFLALAADLYHLIKVPLDTFGHKKTPSAQHHSQPAGAGEHKRVEFDHVIVRNMYYKGSCCSKAHPLM